MESSSEIDLGNTSCESDRFLNVRQHQTLLRHRSMTLKDNMEDGFVLLESPENEIEEKKMEQNYMFGFKKWKAHVTQRPFEERSEAVKSLIYSVTWQYCILHSDWLVDIPCLLVLAVVMAVTVIGWPYAKFCWKLAWYFLWPFGKYVTEASSYELEQAVVQVGTDEGDEHIVTSDADHIIENEGASLLCENKEADLADGLEQNNSRSSVVISKESPRPRKNSIVWGIVKVMRKPVTYVWLLLGGPIIFSVHAVIIILTGLVIFFIPISKTCDPRITGSSPGQIIALCPWASTLSPLHPMGSPPGDTWLWCTVVPQERLFELCTLWCVGVTSYQ
ncbi:putative low affinity vacuolar monovalent cation/H(+) antiporter [Apostichopus japonicus]|uniref:Putative low affinity vacuolar monovalent cation/H(+) antiporter n=1 Tax=Stichopus japonicus TaxID=307972 RepID=A0A2G8KCI1_STIJA|nr:putative low affinity vacuolar monovalent cation/H(+) antiporter [Apostichopus japonicus]